MSCDSRQEQLFKMKIHIFFICVIGITFTVVKASPCTKRDYQQGSFVCVCNKDECDTVAPNTRQPLGVISQYKSSAAQYRLDKRSLKFGDLGPYSYKYTVNRDKKYHSIIGFGGAFTDAAGINIRKLPTEAQNKLLSSYYSPEGIEYTVGRIPMGSCDFSTRPYSYDDNPGDLSLSKFALAKDDLDYKIPVIQKAMSMSKRNISIFGSPWSAPAWMKTDNNMTGKGSLKGEAGGPYHKAWAKYFVRFLQEYEKHGIKLWGLTAQNEPTDGELSHFSFQCMGWTPEQQRDFIIQDLGPALHQNGYAHIKLMILDDTRLMLPLWVKTILNHTEADKYISGVAVHWYIDALTPVAALDIAHDLAPGKFLLGTEACNGELPWEEKVQLGSWDRARAYAHDIIQIFAHPAASKYVSGVAVHWYEDFVVPPVTLDNTYKHFPELFLLASEACAGSMFKETPVLLGSWVRAQNYVHSIIQDLNHWVSGWTDWNIALDTEGGPNWVKNFVDSPVIVNATAGEFYKQPMFYALGHFSKFVVPGSQRIGLEAQFKVDSLETVAFQTPDDSTVVVIHNLEKYSYDILIEDPAIGNVSVKLEPLSVHTFIWWNK